MKETDINKWTTLIIEELKPLLRHKHDNFK